ncbi:unnamed protein product [Boreogadus saida]
METDNPLSDVPPSLAPLLLEPRYWYRKSSPSLLTNAHTWDSPPFQTLCIANAGGRGSVKNLPEDYRVAFSSAVLLVVYKVREAAEDGQRTHSAHTDAAPIDPLKAKGKRSLTHHKLTSTALTLAWSHGVGLRPGSPDPLTSRVGCPDVTCVEGDF